MNNDDVCVSSEITEQGSEKYSKFFFSSLIYYVTEEVSYSCKM